MGLVQSFDLGETICADAQESCLHSLLGPDMPQQMGIPLCLIQSNILLLCHRIAGIHRVQGHLHCICSELTSGSSRRASDCGSRFPHSGQCSSTLDGQEDQHLQHLDRCYQLPERYLPPDLFGRIRTTSYGVWCHGRYFRCVQHHIHCGSSSHGVGFVDLRHCLEEPGNKIPTDARRPRKFHQISVCIDYRTRRPWCYSSTGREDPVSKPSQRDR